jgi:Protein of unknown function (DUF3908)
MNLSYEYFVEDLASGEHTSLMYLIEKFVPKDDIKLFYPKNLFNEKTLTTFLFLENQIFILENNQEVKVQVFNYNQIRNFELVTEGKYKPLHLKIGLTNGETLEFNSVSDTNQIWGRSFAEQIEEIFKLLIQKTTSKNMVKQ